MDVEGEEYDILFSPTKSHLRAIVQAFIGWMLLNVVVVVS